MIGSCGPPLLAGSFCNADEKVAESGWSGVTDAGFVLPADHGHHSDTSGLFVSVLGERHGMNALFAAAPDQFGQDGGGGHGIKPGRLAAYMPVVPLFNVTRPPRQPVAHIPEAPRPTALCWRDRQIERLPCMGMCRVFNYTAPFANRCKRRRKTSSIIP